MKKNVLITFFMAVIIVIFSPLVYAEVVRSYDTQITLQKDGSIQVKEKINYDFEDAYKHGIYREIPVIKKNSDNKEYELSVQVESVKNEQGTAYNYSESRVNNKLRIKVGDANRTITGLHSYIISYLVRGALTYYSDHDELYWNSTGNDWVINLENVNATVRFPEGIPMSSVKTICYTGTIGSTAQECTVKPENNSTSITTAHLEAGSGLTLVVSFPKGLVAILEPKPYIAFEDTWYGKLILGVFFTVLGILAFIWYFVLPIYIPVRWYLTGRDPASQNVRVWYDPPKTKKGRELTPAETGTLIDETADIKDIFGSLIQLAERGYLSISEVKKGEFTLVEGKPAGEELLPFEKKLLSSIFKDKNEVQVKDIKIAEELSDISKKLYAQVVQDEFFPENPNSVRTMYYALAGLALFTGNIFLGIIAFLFGKNMPRKTEYGAQQASIAKSLKTFLTSQERQIEFQAKNQTRLPSLGSGISGQVMFEKLLPYAIAFGVEKIWVERFKDMSLANPSWYTGYNNSAFNAIYFANTMHRSVSTFTTAMTPTHSSSGFSSGFSGGFSGGGGGGGGGGSW
ncbi:MAG: DUF2207 domain-containing protein [bacterium]